MIRELTVLEILEIAEKMERDAARFYRKAAGMYRDPRLSKLFCDLAQWEKCHVRVFANMKNRVAPRGWQGGRHDLSYAEVSPIRVPPAVLPEGEPAKALTGDETRADVLKLAIEKEQRAIGYYTALAEAALGPDDSRIVKDILAEEHKHVRILTQSLQQASG